MRGIQSLFLSMTSAIVLLLIFAIASGVATIVETVYDTKSAWALIYGATWFALIQLLLGINLAYNIYKYKLMDMKKLPVFIFHLSFLFMLLGSAMTRYLGFEANMHIRENTTQDRMYEIGSRLEMKAQKDGKEYKVSVPKQINAVTPNEFNIDLDVGGQKANLQYKAFYKNAEFEYYEADNGDPLIEIVVSDSQNREDVGLKPGDIRELGGVSFAFNTEPTLDKFIKFEYKDGKFTMTSNNNVGYFIMATNEKGEYEAKKPTEFVPMQLYTIGDINFAPKNILEKAQRRLVSKGGQFDALVADLSFNGDSKEVVLYENYVMPVVQTIGGQEFTASWGAREILLPFSLHLKDFELKRYPGSNSPMSYASEVVVKDPKSGDYDYRIYMNHVLDHAGYRFFQSSYDKDERGTILSVNKDPGKIPTYIGYFLLGLGLFFNVVNPHSRFRKLAKYINEDAIKNTAKACILAFACILATPKANAMNLAIKIDENHAKELSTVIVQSADGRMKPFDTVAREILNKVYKKDIINGANANQVALSMMIDAPYWREMPIIAVHNKELKKIIGIDESAKYAKFNDFFEYDRNTTRSSYKLTKYAETASRKRPAERGTFDKDVQKVDERLNILYMVFVGEIFTMFPKLDDPNHTWYAPASAMMYFPKEEREPISRMLQEYFAGVSDASNSGNWSVPNRVLAEIKTYQEEHGKAVIPSKERVDMEILFNKYKIFQSLIPIYLFAGFGLLCFVFIKMAKPRLNINWMFKIVYSINILAFVAHTAGLALRWYISGHAPWSNAYESMIYIAWALSLSGIVFSNRSPISMALTSILAGVTLFVAHLSWMDPQITTLVPVLKSYWLTIHVSVITASYGFLGLCSLLGMFVLVLFALQGKKEHKEMSRNILEATRINEMAMILGLSLLTLGNFLGGIWANESWGRYWGWDSKETWALVSILIYAAVLHIRFVPKLNNQYAFAVTSMFAYWSIIMTYFGVNFYLSGMHSYAAGDPVPVPDFVWMSVVVMVAISILAYFRKPEKMVKL
ncbi:cytochrome c biogenesis protein CcsA [Campylobacter sp. RM16192]|uniref:cytochrome c biogenesis protein CcsA n=1 Tax=Campylobacter sp. RM16192 TaxID=1660080 RepID=UPI0014521C6A|nr:cytochrome c biogenesis protein CcsA [Campylobacter sp. RM16192]QCD52209.1 cytochrome c biogenesis protein [Campylobacter sp. RM16192]